MIVISVKYTGLLRSEAGNSEEKWPLKEGATLEKLLAEVALKYNVQLDDHAKFIIVFNDHGIKFEQWSKQVLRNNDQVLILPSISGG